MLLFFIHFHLFLYVCLFFANEWRQTKRAKTILCLNHVANRISLAFSSIILSVSHLHSMQSFSNINTRYVCVRGKNTECVHTRSDPSQRAFATSAKSVGASLSHIHIITALNRVKWADCMNVFLFRIIINGSNSSSGNSDGDTCNLLLVACYSLFDCYMFMLAFVCTPHNETFN